jgi:hypothetical protein
VTFFPLTVSSGDRITMLRSLDCSWNAARRLLSLSADRAECPSSTTPNPIGILR